MSARTSGSFFPRFLGGDIGLRVSLVRGQFAPAVTVQKIVGRRQGDRATQALVQRLLDLTDNEDATRLGLLEEAFQKFGLCFPRHILPASPARFGSVGLPPPALANEAPPQLAGPPHGDANGPRSLLQRQSKRQRQQHRLGLPQLLCRLRCHNKRLGLL